MLIIFSLFFIIVFFVVFFKIRQNIQDKKLLETVTKSYRGTKTERNLVLKLLKNGIPAQTIFHDLYVKKFNGEFSQIDLVVATKVGIIVFEVKDYSGWIFGKGNQSQWTQVLAYGKRKYRFHNPIMQNNGHITSLRKQLKQFEKVPFYSIIVFYGDCELKDVSFIPQGTYLTYSERVLNIISTILSSNEITNYTDKFEVIRVLKEAVQNGENKETQIKHIKNIRGMLNKG
ncbi:MAG: NERD domain-containing protein [Prevotellaceae bacterium]|jgi:hypothetical protein|nr:NERD domain-containing protein [Prevotellaceae bacterium]